MMKKQRCVCVYIIRHPASGIYYIGSTKDHVRRQINHLSQLRRGEHPNEHLTIAFNFNRSFTWEFINVETIEKAKELEYEMIRGCKDDPLLANVQLSKSYPPHHAEAISRSRKKIIYTTAWREAIATAQRGRRMSPDSIEKTAAAKRIKVVIDGVEYKSIAEASNVLGIRANTITRRVQNPSFSNYMRLAVPND